MAEAFDASSGASGSEREPRSLRRAGVIEMLQRAVGFRRDALAHTSRIYDRYGPAVLHRFGPYQGVDLFGPDAQRWLLLDREGNLSAQRSWTLIMGRIFRGGLLLRDGEDHRQQRRILQAAFTTQALRGYVDQMVPRISTELSGWQPGRRLAFPAVKELTLALAAEVFLGVDLGPEVQGLNRAFEATVAASMSLVRLPLPGLEFSRGLRGRRTMLEAFGRRLADKRRSSAPDLFSQLCRAESETGERFSDEEILDHLVFLMMAAHDTTTSTLTSMAYELARHPEWQERVREECFAVGEAPDFEALARLPAIELVTNEILRRYPPLSTIPRVAVRDCEFEGYPIPEGAMVTVFPIHTHHMAEWWTAPFRFDPERFSEARAEHRRHTHVFTPFGGGAHVCLGMRFAELQIKAVLHALVRRFRWTVPQGYRMPVQQAPISKPLDGLPIFLDRLG